MSRSSFVGATKVKDISATVSNSAIADVRRYVSYSITVQIYTGVSVFQIISCLY